MKEFDDFVQTIKRLRDPHKGCPWDIKQTHLSLVPNLIEELYEVVEAVENENMQDLEEELGDLMLHIVMQTQIAEEKNEFTLIEVLKKINLKLKRRHPHIFGNVDAVDVTTVKKNWEEIKQQEKKNYRTSVVDGIPKSMSALIIAQRMQEKAAAVGFDWNEAKGAFAKLEEEIKEFKFEADAENLEKMQTELGDILFSVVNVARKSGLDAETALRETISKFERRFKHVEKHYRKNGKDMKKSSLEQLDEIWDEAKKNEKPRI
ncbi:MAG: nucleoside triphosphate pyrophosphohydrolase [Candidatus Cloacimonadota bacterium]|nr:nucleoside triphosphate pyrophosphohydrolase [Candidatus Cloacimonadota bacterium]